MFPVKVEKTFDAVRVVETKALPETYNFVPVPVTVPIATFPTGVYISAVLPTLDH